jgi:hypothetical protein
MWIDGWNPTNENGKIGDSLLWLYQHSLANDKHSQLAGNIFTSLRDGNRPHRIIGLTQQGQDAGAERKVERRS